MEDENIELKTCPFCGGKAEVKIIAYHYKEWHKVMCIICGAGTRLYSDEDQCIYSWNEREKE